MTPSQNYRAALEAAAKLCEKAASPISNDCDYSIYDHSTGATECVHRGDCLCLERQEAAESLAAAIRALPVPQDDGDMVMVPREPTEAIIEAGWEFHSNGKWTVSEDSFFGGLYRAMINAKE